MCRRRRRAPSGAHGHQNKATHTPEPRGGRGPLTYSTNVLHSIPKDKNVTCQNRSFRATRSRPSGCALRRSSGTSDYFTLVHGVWTVMVRVLLFLKRKSSGSYFNCRPCVPRLLRLWLQLAALALHLNPLTRSILLPGTLANWCEAEEDKALRRRSRSVRDTLPSPPLWIRSTEIIFQIFQIFYNILLNLSNFGGRPMTKSMQIPAKRYHTVGKQSEPVKSIFKIEKRKEFVRALWYEQ